MNLDFEYVLCNALHPDQTTKNKVWEKTHQEANECNANLPN